MVDRRAAQPDDRVLPGRRGGDLAEQFFDAGRGWTLVPPGACYGCYGGAMTKTIPHRELRNHSSDVLRRVQAGETIQVTNHGEVVAVLSPFSQGLAPRVVAAKHRGGFASIPRVGSKETIGQALDALREE